MSRVNKERLEKRIDEWKEKVLKSAEGSANTHAMICDIDKIIAEEFDRDAVIG